MSEFLLYYEKVHPTTWAYLSSLLLLGLFFKFSRFWSMRNLDLVLLILLAPGLLLWHFGREQENAAELLAQAQSPPQAAASPLDEAAPARAQPADEPLSPEAAEARDDAPAARSFAQEHSLEEARSLQFYGFLWLLAVGLLLLVRLIADPVMVRRPLLEPNLSLGGIIFLGCSLFVFLTANVITGAPTDDDLAGAREADRLLHSGNSGEEPPHMVEHGPGLAWLHVFPSIATTTLAPVDQQLPRTEQRAEALAVTAKAMAILAHLAVVLAMVFIGHRHFGNVKMGVGAATLYLMLPYTAIMTGRTIHVLPAALLVWAIALYRRPLAAGMFLGLAISVVYYPLFLLPLWISFYWPRGLARFLAGVLSMLGLIALLLVFRSADAVDYWANLRAMFGLWSPVMEGLQGVWGLGWDPIYRLPVLTAFIALSIGFAFWPPQKNLGTLLSCSAAVMVAAQFWHGFGGGLYMAWYLPLLLLTVFRPNLEDRIALVVLGEGWTPRHSWFRASDYEKAA